MNTPKVSVVITAYNAMDYLPETLSSVLRQSFIDFEVLLVDDGSSDSIVQWASELVDPRVRFISQENQGVCVARNTGIAHARGEYIAFLDSDDLWEATKLEKQIRYLESNPNIGVVHTWLSLIDEHGCFTGRVLTSSAEGDIWEKIVQKNMVACSSVLIRHCCFKDVGMFDSSLCVAEDWDMWLRIAKHYQFGVIKESLVYYRQRANSKSKRYPEKLQDFRKIIEKAFQSAPLDLLYLRNRSYGHISLCIAWKYLQSVDADYKMANIFCCQATNYYPQLYFSDEYVRLTVAIALMKWLGAKGYRRILSLFYNLRQHISTAIRAINLFTSYFKACDRTQF